LLFDEQKYLSIAGHEERINKQRRNHLKEGIFQKSGKGNFAYVGYCKFR
jgi:hypothetical protein